MNENRLKNALPDYKLVIVRRPKGWRPKNLFESPEQFELLNEFPVASYEEAYDDLERCNRLSLHYNLDLWALIQSPRSTSSHQIQPPDENA